MYVSPAFFACSYYIADFIDTNHASAQNCNINCLIGGTTDIGSGLCTRYR